MKKILCLIVPLTLSLLSYAQLAAFIPPDYKAIEKKITDKDSKFFYDSLMVRYRAFDTTLTPEDYRHIYYGYSFSDNYHPYGISDSDKQLSEYYMKDQLSDEDLNGFIELAGKELAENPIDLRVIAFLSYVYGKKNDLVMQDKLMNTFNQLIKTIRSTGDGETCESAYHVLYIAHEYELLSYYGFEVTQQSLINDKKHSCDLMTLRENDYDVEGIYFNVDKMFATLSK